MGTGTGMVGALIGTAIDRADRSRSGRDQAYDLVLLYVVDWKQYATHMRVWGFHNDPYLQQGGAVAALVDPRRPKIIWVPGSVEAIATTRPVLDPETGAIPDLGARSGFG